MASEANPLMAPLVHNPLVFLGVKVSLVTLGCILIYRNPHLTISRYAAIIGVAVYVGVLAIHTDMVFKLYGLS